MFSIFSSLKNNKYDKNKREKDVADNNDASANSGERVVLCPSCSQKIKFKIPLKKDIAKCSTCSSKFKIRIDTSGHLYITNLEQPDDSVTIDSIVDFFNILGVETTATADEIKAAYKVKIAEYHPDKVQKLGDKIKKVADIEAKKLMPHILCLKKSMIYSL